jgi:hypothetical protein
MIAGGPRDGYRERQEGSGGTIVMTVRTSLAHPLQIAEVPAGPEMEALGLTVPSLHR